MPVFPGETRVVGNFEPARHRHSHIRAEPEMNAPHHKTGFLLGNALLAIALAMLIFLDTLWAQFGTWAMGLWMAVAGVGMYLITRDKGPTNFPD